MSPSLSWEAKAARVWVKVLPFLCHLQIRHSPQEIFVHHIPLKKQQQFLMRKVNEYQETKPKWYSEKNKVTSCYMAPGRFQAAEASSWRVEVSLFYEMKRIEMYQDPFQQASVRTT